MPKQKEPKPTLAWVLDNGGVRAIEKRRAYVAMQEARRVAVRTVREEWLAVLEAMLGKLDAEIQRVNREVGGWPQNRDNVGLAHLLGIDPEDYRDPSSYVTQLHQAVATYGDKARAERRYLRRVLELGQAHTDTKAINAQRQQRYWTRQQEARKAAETAAPKLTPKQHDERYFARRDWVQSRHAALSMTRDHSTTESKAKLAVWTRLANQPFNEFFAAWKVDKFAWHHPDKATPGSRKPSRKVKRVPPRKHKNTPKTRSR